MRSIEDGKGNDLVIKSNQGDERNRLSPKGFGRRGKSPASSGLVDDIPYRLARPFSHPTPRRSERDPREFFDNVLAEAAGGSRLNVA